MKKTEVYNMSATSATSSQVHSLYPSVAPATSVFALATAPSLSELEVADQQVPVLAPPPKVSARATSLTILKDCTPVFEEHMRVISQTCIFVLSALAITFAALSQPVVCLGLLSATSASFIGYNLITHALDQKRKNEALCRSVEFGDIDNIQLLWNLGANINALNQDGYTPFHLAVRLGDIEMMQLLLSLGADVNTQDSSGKTALAWACGGKTSVELNEGVVQFLLNNAQVHPTLADRDGVTPLHWAIKAGNAQSVSQMVSLLCTKNIGVGAADRDGLTPLHWAAKAGNEQIVSLLCAQRIYVDAKDRDGRTALHLACDSDSTDPSRLLVIRRLLEKGAYPHEQNNQGQNCWDLARNKKNNQILELLAHRPLPKPSSGSSVSVSSRCAPCVVVAAQVASAAPIQAVAAMSEPESPSQMPSSAMPVTDLKNCTPVFAERDRTIAQICVVVFVALAITFAALSQVGVCLGLLGAAGMSVFGYNYMTHVIDQEQKNAALFLAVQSGDVKNVRLFLQLGAELGCLDNDGRTPLHRAVDAKQREVAEFLIANGALSFTNYRYNKNWGQEEKDQALWRAVEWDDMETLKLLLVMGANGHMICNGYALLHLACLWGRIELIKFLVKGKYVDIDVKNTDGLTPLQTIFLAPRHYWHKDSSAVPLLSLGANVKMLTTDGNNLLHLALSAEHPPDPTFLESLIRSGVDIHRKNNNGVTPLVIFRRRRRYGHYCEKNSDWLELCAARVARSMEGSPATS